MKVAALYDVHGNVHALEAVLAELEAANVDSIVFGGDFVGGPYPRETLELVRGLDATLVRGNAEQAPDEWNRARLAPSDVAALADLPLTAELDGSALLPRDTDRRRPASVGRVDRRADRRALQWCERDGCDRAHAPQFDRRTGALRVVNAGSVGIPWEGEEAAFWTLVEDGEPVHRRTEIDLARAVRDVRASGWPRAERFVDENLLHPFAPDDAIADIEGIV